MARADTLGPARPAPRVRPPLAVAAAVAAVACLLLLAVGAASVVAVLTGEDGATGDFISFYAAGTIVRTGHTGSLYDTAAQEWVQRASYEGAVDSIIGYPLPVFAAWIFAPFSKLPFAQAYVGWLALNVALLAALAHGLAKHLSGVPELPRRAFVAAFALSTPAIAGLTLGQVDLIVFAGLLGGYLLMRRDHSTLAGVALALAVIKPHFLIGVVIMLVVWRQWDTLLALAGVSAPLLLLPPLMSSPGALWENVAYIAHYPGGEDRLGVSAAMMSNWRGFVASATGRDAWWAWMPGAIAIAAATTATAVRRWRISADGTAAADQSYALAVLLPLLVTPHLHTQSLVLLFIPGAIALRGWFRPDGGRAGDAAAESDAAACVLLVYAAIFALWFTGVQGLMLMVFPLLAAFWACASRFPGEEGPVDTAARLAALGLTASDGRRYDRFGRRPLRYEGDGPSI